LIIFKTKYGALLGGTSTADGVPILRSRLNSIKIEKEKEMVCCKINKITFWAMAFMLIAPLAMAQTDNARMGPDRYIQHFDQDNDGRVSEKEFTAVHQETFAKMDRNGDGIIDKDDRAESDQRMGRIGRGIFQHMDTNDDQVITADEFAAGVEERFNRLDKNQDGYIDENEAPAPRRHGRRMGMAD